PARRQLSDRLAEGVGEDQRLAEPRLQVMGQVTDLAVSAILLAGLYATMAYGLGLIYGVLRIVNLNHGGMIMAGAYAGWGLQAQFGVGPHLSRSPVPAPGFVVRGGLLRLLAGPASC